VAPRIRDARYIDERPAEVEGRVVPGRQKGGLVIDKTVFATLVRSNASTG